MDKNVGEKTDAKGSKVSCQGHRASQLNQKCTYCFLVPIQHLIHRPRQPQFKLKALSSHSDNMKSLGSRITMMELHGFQLYHDPASGFPNGAGRPIPFIGSRRLFYGRVSGDVSAPAQRLQHQPVSVAAGGWLRLRVHQSRVYLPIGTRGAPVTPTQQVSPAPQRRPSNIDPSYITSFFPFGVF